VPAEARCEKYDLPVSMCAHCTGAETRARAEERTERKGTAGPWFAAAFPGECSGCGDPIIPGDTIRASASYGYECEECGDAADRGEPS
jgi:hypothetical protein